MKNRLPLVILLQGPVGPFFSLLGKGLQAAGFSVIKINFNAGDAIFTRKLPSILFRDGLSSWQAWFEQFLEGYRPDRVILFGDQRPYHQVAVTLCNSLGIDIWCLEEGYIRPDYITAERGGNNASSRMPRDMAAFEKPRIARPCPLPISQNGFRAMAWAALRYFTAMKLGGFVTRHYNHHRDRPAHSEIICWLLNVYRKNRHLLKNSRETIDLIDRFERRYFVVALQVHDDLQLRVHGAGWNMERVIEATIRTFAHHAPAHDRLVFKSHPLDRGHRSYSKLVFELARVAGIEDRVMLLDDAPMGLLLRHARGMVTVNSTSALLALQRNCPVFVMGEALFRIPQLVSAGSEDRLSSFWRMPFMPNPGHVNTYISRLIHETQVNGSFYISEYFDVTIENIINHIFSRERAVEDVEPESRISRRAFA